MFAWIWKFLTDDSAFAQSAGTIQQFISDHAVPIRTALLALAVGVYSGEIPTGIDGGGKWIGAVLAVLVPSVRAGDKNVVKVDPATGQIVPVKQP